MEAITLLEEVSPELSEVLRNGGTTIFFDSVLENQKHPNRQTVAYFDPKSNRIGLHPLLMHSSAAVRATHLAHEAFHVMMREQNIVDEVEEEYRTRQAEIEVWKKLKERYPSEKDAALDSWEWMIDNLPKSTVKDYLRTELGYGRR